MNRREFHKMLLASGVVPSLTGFGAGVATAQTANGSLTSIARPEPATLVLAINQQVPTQTVGTKIYEGLLSYDFDINPVPMLAQEWSISEDGLEYTFKLVENAVWHDGKPFTAADVVFSCNVMLPETHPRARSVFQRCESITAADDHTVVFRLKEPFAPFIRAFETASAPMMPKHIYEGTDYKKNPANEKPIGTGPFKFKDWVRGSHIHLIANPDYYLKGKPGLTEIFYRVIPDAASRSVAMESGESQLSQWGDIEAFDIERLAALPQLEMTTKGYEFFSPVSWIEMNLRHEPFNDVRFRKAMMHLIDRQFVADRVYFGLARPASGALASTTKFYEPDVTHYDFSVDKAVALLDEIGMKPDANGIRVKFSYLVPPYGESATRLAEFFRQAMAAGGIEVVLETTDVAGWASSVSNWDYQCTANQLNQFGDPALGVSRSYVSSNIRKGVMFTNTQGYENAEVDRLFAEAAVKTTDEERQALYSEVQKLLANELPVLWLCEVLQATLYDRRLENVVIGATGVNSNFAEVKYTS